MPRAQFTAAQEEKAQLPGFPNVRGFADSQVGKIATEPFKIEPQKELVFLALSGGGADGAFGAGIVNGWTETKQRPEFKPFTAAGFGNWFRGMCEQAGIPKSLSAHGLRKAGATRLAEHGCTDHEIMAWGGWKTLLQVQRYTRAANRKRLAMQAADKLETGTKVANLSTGLANQE